jgi:hypothetical protein
MSTKSIGATACADVACTFDCGATTCAGGMSTEIALANARVVDPSCCPGVLTSLLVGARAGLADAGASVGVMNISFGPLESSLGRLIVLRRRIGHFARRCQAH